MTKANALVIGASGDIGQELVRQLVGSGQYQQVHAVSRTAPKKPLTGVVYAQLQSDDEQAIALYCQRLKSSQEQFALVVCCIGSLHGQTKNQQSIMPEKRIEDLNLGNLSHYFTTNTIIPALWLKNVEPLLKGEMPAKLVFFSARVASITDNQLGGWYGYRASKAGLNMLIKCAQIEFHRRAKNVCLISYHPGTVDTSLSKPFQSNVPKDKLFTVDFTVSQLLYHMAMTQAQQGPYYMDWQGQSIAW
jgi:NAD(P)-dependent dehydrogenase (short-subunit alcohol dehydrogenase family)